MLLAGRDTTAGTLSFTILELSRHPHVVAKLRREILELLGPHRAPTYEDLKSMPYLQHTINEVLRLYPAVPFNVRMSLHDTTLPRGGGKDGLSPVGIRKDTPIGYSTLHMQRNPEIYQPIPPGFPDVKEFVPERWDGGWSPKPWTYIPFNGGPRICVGRESPTFSSIYPNLPISASLPLTNPSHRNPLLFAYPHLPSGALFYLPSRSSSYLPHHPLRYPALDSHTIRQPIQP